MYAWTASAAHSRLRRERRTRPRASSVTQGRTWTPQERQAALHACRVPRAHTLPPRGPLNPRRACSATLALTQTSLGRPRHPLARPVSLAPSPLSWGQQARRRAAIAWLAHTPTLLVQYRAACA